MTTMKISRETLDRIAKHGKFGESYENVINRLIDKIEGKEE